MNEIWLVYAHKNYTYDISDIVSYADYEEEADEQIARFQNICNQEPTINVEEKLEEIRKSLDHIVKLSKFLSVNLELTLLSLEFSLLLLIFKIVM